jgi:hypothetical protein
MDRISTIAWKPGAAVISCPREAPFCAPLLEFHKGLAAVVKPMTAFVNSSPGGNPPGDCSDAGRDRPPGRCVRAGDGLPD